MKIEDITISQIYGYLTPKGYTLAIDMLESEQGKIKPLLASIGEELSNKKYSLEIKRSHKKRSLDANAYAWVLIRKISEKTNVPPVEVYRLQVQNFRAYEIVPIHEDNIEHWDKIWTAKGTGWITEDMGECRNIKGYHNIRCYYGSSTYNIKEMSDFLELIIQDCKALGIETMTPNELTELKASWNNSK